MSDDDVVGFSFLTESEMPVGYLNPGETIFKEGETAKELYVIKAASGNSAWQPPAGYARDQRHLRRDGPDRFSSRQRRRKSPRLTWRLFQFQRRNFWPLSPGRQLLRSMSSAYWSGVCVRPIEHCNCRFSPVSEKSDFL